MHVRAITSKHFIRHKYYQMDEKFRIIDVNNEKIFIAETPVTFFELLKIISEFVEITTYEIYQYIFFLSCYQECVTKQYNNYILNHDMYIYNFLTQSKSCALFVDFSSSYQLELCTEPCDLCCGEHNDKMCLCDGEKIKKIDDKINSLMVLVESKFNNLSDDDLLSHIWSSYDMATYMFYCENVKIINNNQ